MNITEYTLEELFERAKQDEAWEPSEKIRNELVNRMVMQLLNSIT